MSGLEHLLATELPRPAMDPRFRRELLERILEGAVEHPLAAVDGSSHRFRYYLGGAMVGAAALAVGAAFGWRLRGPREDAVA